MSRAYDDKDIWQCQKPLRLLLLLSCFHTGDQCVPTPVTTTVSNCDIMQQRVCSHCKECCVKSTVLIGPAHQAAVTVSSLVSTMTLHVSQTRSWWQTVFLKNKIKINCSSPSAIIWAFLNLESRGNERTTQTSELVLLFLWNIVLLCKIEPVFPTHPCVH